MVSSLDHFVDQLMSCRSTDALWNCMAHLGYNVGFESCSLTMASSKGPILTSTLLQSDMPDEFHEGYIGGGVMQMDPFLRLTCEGLKPSRIVVNDLGSFPNASPEHRRMLDFIKSLGFSNGFGVPVRTSKQQEFGGWVYSTNQPVGKIDSLVKEKGRQLQLASILAYERMIALGLDGGDTEKVLSAREGDCLLWLCHGLRVAQIADQLSIGESAVNLYITNAKRKLGARTREQAVARALLGGEIEP